MIRAIIFDCFGVLTSEGWLPFKQKYFGKDPALFDEASQLAQQVNAGLADYHDFVHQVAAMAGVSPEAANKQIDANVADETLFAYIKTSLKPRYKIGMLSNAADNWLGALFTPDQVALFDGICLSYELGYTKPDPRAYQAIVAKLGVEPTECVFIDDQERYCTAAQDVGMQTITYKNAVQCISALEKITGASSR